MVFLPIIESWFEHGNPLSLQVGAFLVRLLRARYGHTAGILVRSQLAYQVYETLKYQMPSFHNWDISWEYPLHLLFYVSLMANDDSKMKPDAIQQQDY